MEKNFKKKPLEHRILKKGHILGLGYFRLGMLSIKQSQQVQGRAHTHTHTQYLHVLLIRNFMSMTKGLIHD